ncbi:MAG: hypothetical protein WCO96_07515 [Actinomycetes bacterium]
MNTRRAESYMQLIDVLSKEDGVTLRPSETEALRNAADALFFEEESVAEARDGAQAVLDALVDSGRWSEERANQLAASLDGCGALAVI